MNASARLLVVEDDASAADALELALADTGNVHVSSTGVDAIEDALRERPDFALVDLRLPDQPGETVIDALRTRYPRLPIVAMSASSDSERIRRLVRHGVRDFLEKPFHVDALLEAVERALQAPGREAERSNACAWVGTSTAARGLREAVRRLRRRPTPVLVRCDPGWDIADIARDIHGDRRARLLSRPPDADERARALTNGEVLIVDARGANRGATGWLASLASGEPIVVETPPAAEAPAADSPVSVLDIPSLRDRREDALWLLRRLIERRASRLPRPIRRIDLRLLWLVGAHSWPGNQREMEAWLEAALARADGDALRLACAPRDPGFLVDAAATMAECDDAPLDDAVDLFLGLCGDERPDSDSSASGAGGGS